MGWLPVDGQLCTTIVVDVNTCVEELEFAVFLRLVGEFDVGVKAVYVGRDNFDFVLVDADKGVVNIPEPHG